MPLSRPARRGVALVEFAIVSLALYVLVAGAITFGFLLYAAQGLQIAADVTARELARMPFASDRDFEQLLPVVDGTLPAGEAAMAASVFDEEFLVVDLDDATQFPASGRLVDATAGWPILNRQLFPLMIVDFPEIGGVRRRLLRYPGALLSTDRTADGFTVGIPVVTGRNADGVETVRWVPVVEEIDTESNAAGNEGANPDPFSIDSAERGLVALRINYPFQSPVLSGFRPSPAGRFEPNGAFINSADDASITELNAADAPGARLGLPSVSGGVFTGPYGGDYGLGTQAAFGRPVRPFRRVLTAQAVYRREIFGPPAS